MARKMASYIGNSPEYAVPSHLDADEVNTLIQAETINATMALAFGAKRVGSGSTSSSSGGLTTEQVEALIAAAGHTTTSDVNTLIAAAGHQSASDVNTLIAAAGHTTTSDVNTLISNAGHTTTSDVNTLIAAAGHVAMDDVTTLALALGTVGQYGTGGVDTASINSAIANAGHATALTETIETPTSNGQTDFTISYTVNMIQVFLNGVKLLNGTDFTATNGTTVSLTTGVQTTDRVEFCTL